MNADTGTKKTVVACLGKGGTGKTMTAALLGKSAMAHGRQVLFIDADPVGGLVTALDRNIGITLGQVRDEIVALARTEGRHLANDDLLEQIDAIMTRAIVTSEDYALVAMGQSLSPGCYCAINTLLRQGLTMLTSPYDFVVIDAEAGIEQVNRQVVAGVSHVLLLCDGSRRAWDACQQVRTTMGRVAGMQQAQAFLVLNRVTGAIDEQLSIAQAEGFLVAGVLPSDHLISQWDREGRSLLDLPPECEALSAAGALLEKLIEIDRPASLC